MKNSKEKIETFTTRPDTIFAVNFLVLAPEHELIEKITTSEQSVLVKNYIEKLKSKSEIERQAEKNKWSFYRPLRYTPIYKTKNCYMD